MDADVDINSSGVIFVPTSDFVKENI